jgi:hypothetical protein
MNTLLNKSNDIIFQVVSDDYKNIEDNKEKQEKAEVECCNRRLHQFDIDDLLQKMIKES